MAEIFEIKEQEERMILVGVATSDGDDTAESLDELEELIKTAGAETIGRRPIRAPISVKVRLKKLDC